MKRIASAALCAAFLIAAGCSDADRHQTTGEASREIRKDTQQGKQTIKEGWQETKKELKEGADKLKAETKTRRGRIEALNERRLELLDLLEGRESVQPEIPFVGGRGPRPRAVDDDDPDLEHQADKLLENAGHGRLTKKGRKFRGVESGP